MTKEPVCDLLEMARNQAQHGLSTVILHLYQVPEARDLE